MRVLYPQCTINLDTKTIRKFKAKFLVKFQSDGYYLIDSLDKPFEEKYSSSQKIKFITFGQDALLKRVKTICDSKTKVVLIAAPVFKANYGYLKNNGINVTQDEFIDFPTYDKQKKFREKLKGILNI